MKSIDYVRTYITENPLRTTPINDFEKKWMSGVLAYANDLLTEYAAQTGSDSMREDSFRLVNTLLGGTSSYDECKALDEAEEDLEDD